MIENSLSFTSAISPHYNTPNSYLNLLSFVW